MDDKTSGACFAPGASRDATGAASVSAHTGNAPSRKPKPCLLDPSALVRDLRACACGVRSFKSDQGDYGIADDAADMIEWSDWQRRYAIEWANRSVSSVQEHMWAAEDCLRDLVALLANTGFHNSLEMAAARKLLARDRDAGLAENAKRSNPEGAAARAEGIDHPSSEQSS